MISRDVLFSLYWDEGMSLPQIAHSLNISYSGLYYYFKKYNIPRRTTVNHVKLSEYAKNFLRGELLGDGHLAARYGKSASFKYTTKYRIYAVWLVSQLEQFGIKLAGHIRYRKYVSGTYNFTTKYYRELKEIHNEFYYDGKKRVPQNIVLTPVLVRQWYIGDGSLQNGYKNYSVVFATDCFTRKDVERLVEAFYKIGITATIHNCRNRLYIPVSETGKFFNYIGECPVPIQSVYGYKWIDKAGREETE